jgi:hypothetical protein
MRADGCKISQIGYTNGAFVLTVMIQGQERAEIKKKKRGYKEARPISPLALVSDAAPFDLA